MEVEKVSVIGVNKLTAEMLEIARKQNYSNHTTVKERFVFLTSGFVKTNWRQLNESSNIKATSLEEFIAAAIAGDVLIEGCRLKVTDFAR